MYSQLFRVSRGGCWQCLPDRCSRLAEVLTLSQVAYNGQSLTQAEAGACVKGLATSVCYPPCSLDFKSNG